MKKATVKDGFVTLADGTEYQFTKGGSNGNRLYYVSWLALGLPAYESTALTREAGLKKVKTKAFGGGFSFQCSTGQLIKQAEFFHSLGLHRAVDKEPTPFLQKKLSSIEIEGLIAMFNEFYSDYMESVDGEPYTDRHGFFWCDGHLQSEDRANGIPFPFQGYNIEGLAKRDGVDLTYMVLQDKNGKEFICEFNKYNGQWYILGTKKSGKAW
jgi:hypothetical protein